MVGTGSADEIVLRYPSAADARRDQLGDERHGLLVRMATPLQAGDRPRVAIELVHEKVALRVQGEVRWVTPLVKGALVGLALRAATHRDTVQLDLLFGRRSAGPSPEPAYVPVVAPPPAAAPAAGAGMPTAAPGRPLSVAMLQPNSVLRQVLVNALARFGQEKGGWDVSVEARAEPDSFLEALSAHRRGLAIIDCDGLGAATEPLVSAIRSHGDWERLPLILLSSDGRSRLEDGHAVYLRKPVAMKAFVDVAGILVGQGRA